MTCKYTTLLLPPLLDVGDGKLNSVEIVTTHHQFAPDAKESGFNSPIFGSKYKSHCNKIYHKSFGLPFFRFKKGVQVRLSLINKTHYSFDLHWH